MCNHNEHLGFVNICIKFVCNIYILYTYIIHTCIHTYINLYFFYCFSPHVTVHFTYTFVCIYLWNLCVDCDYNCWSHHFLSLLVKKYKLILIINKRNNYLLKIKFFLKFKYKINTFLTFVLDIWSCNKTELWWSNSKNYCDICFCARTWWLFLYSSL